MACRSTAQAGYYPPYYGGGGYYPRPPTWGLHVGYNPWTGWNFGVSWSNGFASVGIGWSSGWGGGCCGGYYGGGYRGPTVINTGDINIGNNVNIGNRDNIGNTLEGRGNINRDNLQSNIYERDGNRERNADRAGAQNNLREARPATDRANNVYADRSGNVARRNNDQWETRENGQWNRDNNNNSNRAATTRENRPSTQPSSRPSTRDIDRSSLNRSHQSRQHGASRQHSRPTRMRGGRRR